MKDIKDREIFSERIILEAGKLLLEFFEENLKIEKKGEIDLVTDADFASERFLKEEIGKKFPEDGVLGEERGEINGNNEYLWIIDPLDGTVNFSHAYPFFSISIALQKHGDVVMGLVYDPIRNELFKGIKGEGGFLNGKRIKVSGIGRLIDSMLATGFPYDIHESKDDTLELFVRFVKSAQAVRRDGSAALDICYVAMGRFDGFWERRLKPWDTAAAKLILEESGGIVSDFSGGKYSIFGDEILCSNGKIHSEMIKILKG